MGFRPSVGEKVTIYPRFTDLLTGNETNIRIVLNGCFWNENSIAIFNKFGTTTGFNVTLMIPLDPKTTGRTYINPTAWKQLSYADANEKYWTLDPLQATSLPIIVRGEHLHEFQFQSPTAATGAQPPRLSIQESNFLSAYPSAARRSKDINLKQFGRKKMHHMEVRT